MNGERIIQGLTEAVSYTRARHSAKQDAVMAAMTALTTASHAIELLRGLKTFSADLPVCINHDAPLLANHMEATVERMAASLRGGGRIR